MSKNLKEKLKILNEFKETFTSNSYTLQDLGIYRGLKIDDILDPLFEDELYYHLSVSNYIYGGAMVSADTSAGRFINIIQNNNMRYMTAELSGEDRDLIFTKLLSCIEEIDISNNKMAGEKFALKPEEYPKFLLELIDRGALYKFVDNFENFIKVAADYAMTFSSLAEIEKIKETFDKDDFLSGAYVGYPLVIINKNLKKEERIKIIKKTYRKKDLNKYTEFIRQSLTDMNDLDDFIEATILQNNRVRNEAEGIMELIKRIFIGTRSDNFSVSIEVSELENVKDFLKKYNKYFTIEALKKLPGPDWKSISNVNNFIFQIYKDEGIADKLRVATALPSVGNKLFPDNKNMPMDVKGNDEIEKAYFRYLLIPHNIMKRIKNFPEETIFYANKYPDIFAQSFSETVSFKALNRSYSYYRDITNETIELIKTFVSGLEEENFEKFEFFSEEYFKNLGIEDSTRWNKDQEIASNIELFSVDLMGLFADIIAENPLYKPYIYERYFRNFQDDDYMNDMLTHIAFVFNETVSKSFLGYLKEATIQSAITKIFKRVIDFTKTLADDTTKEISNLEQTRDALLIICSL